MVSLCRRCQHYGNSATASPLPAKALIKGPWDDKYSRWKLCSGKPIDVASAQGPAVNIFGETDAERSVNTLALT